MRICERNSSANTKVSEGGGGGSGSVDLDHRFPCSPWKTPSWSRYMCLKETVTSWRAHATADFLAGSVNPLGPTLEQSAP